MTDANKPTSEIEAPAETAAPVETKPAAAEAKPSPVPEEPPANRKYFWGVGRRKSAVARVRLASGSGKIEINGRTLNDYFTAEKDRKAIFGPLEVTNTGGRMDVFVNAAGGGPTGQSGAIVMGLGRALKAYDTSLEVALRGAGFLTRDSRMKERKKYGSAVHGGASSSPSDNRMAEIEMTNVVVVFDESADKNIDELSGQLRQLGLCVESVDSDNGVVEGCIESAKVKSLEKVPHVKYVRGVFNYVDEPGGDGEENIPE